MPSLESKGIDTARPGSAPTGIGTDRTGRLQPEKVVLQASRRAWIEGGYLRLTVYTTRAKTGALQPQRKTLDVVGLGPHRPRRVFM